MQIASLRKRVTLQRRGMTQDAFGQQTTTWTDVCTIWASIEPLSAHELLAAQSVTSEVSHKITIRYRADLADPSVVAALRVSYGTRIFNISGAMNPDERNRVVQLLVAEGLNRG